MPLQFRILRRGDLVVEEVRRILLNDDSRASITHCIFDFDGLLVDTERCYTLANQTMLRKFGREFTPKLNEYIPMAICSGSRGVTFGPREKAHKEWLDLIKLKFFCGDEPSIKRGKPYPDPYLATMNRLVSDSQKNKCT
ncbi:unnamed protein product [Strongylus vulgaris]|uniref:Uncharacterized protein n=1 Tax=Strongylus vulgaris TaxID=40348 RepID=A0A3P7JKF3_STRVU|nr:unnamed protein product [Strongylus vulgaris]